MLILFYIFLFVVNYISGIEYGNCTTSKDCSLNGDCISGKCECDPAWSGAPACDIATFDLITKTDTRGVYNSTETTWGGYPIQDDSGKWHIFHAQMLNSCPLNSWKKNSIVARSVADKVNGPYTFVEEVYPSFSHNPTIRKTKNGTYVIYFIGGWKTEAQKCNKKQVLLSSTIQNNVTSASTCDALHWPKECGSNMPGPSGDTCGAEPLNAGCGIATLHSNSLEGPWSYSPVNITNQWLSDIVYCAHTNPAPVFLPNGTVIVAFNAGYCSNKIETIGIATAPHWSGPYNLLSLVPILGDPTKPHRCEDPFLWKSERGWHLLTHNQQGPQGVSSYAFSEDAIHWTLSSNTPYNCVIQYSDGTNATVSGCGNRPQIVFDKLGKPLWLINGAFRAKTEENGADAFTLFRKFKAH